jgi:hypothetical protein
MLKIPYNPSHRKRFALKRLCLNCQTYFSCDGSCEQENIIEDMNFCYCPICWEKVFSKRTLGDEYRGKCQILKDYLNKKGKFRFNWTYVFGDENAK